ncbi:hypothetical protein [Streptomyces sp. c-19]|uniref:hypothetical protein n=1 Tax=Streptomyces sp. c-19 TaxID=2789275 RepID=UPI00397FCD86
MVDDRLEVPYSEDRIKDAPHVDVDGGGRLSTREERRLYEHSASLGATPGGGRTGPAKAAGPTARPPGTATADADRA